MTQNRYIAQGGPAGGDIIVVKGEDVQEARGNAMVEFYAGLPGVVSVELLPSGNSLVLWIRNYLATIDSGVRTHLPVSDVEITIRPKLISVDQKVLGLDGEFEQHFTNIRLDVSYTQRIHANVCNLLGLPSKGDLVFELSIRGEAGEAPVITRRSYLL